MKIATFDINNVDRRLPNLMERLAEAEPNVAAGLALRLVLWVRHR
jgi:hypothetical protein